MRAITLAAVAALLILPAAGEAATYATIITVGKTGATFTNPLQALAYVTAATEKAPVLVKILAGTFDLGDAPLVLKPYVDVEGSGQDKTILTSSAMNADGDTCTTGTVRMANHSALRNLKVINATPKGSGESLTAGIVFDNVLAKAEAVTVLVGDNAVPTTRNYGVCAVGPNARVALNGVTIETHNGRGGQAGAIALINDASLSVDSSKLLATAMEEGHTHVVDCANGSAMTGRLAISSSKVTGMIKGTSGGNRGIDARDCQATVTGTTVELSGGDDNLGLIANNLPMSVVNSLISSTGKVLLLDGEATVSIASSTLKGELPTTGTISLKGNRDGGQAPIADR